MEEWWEVRVHLELRVDLGDCSCHLREVRSPFVLQWASRNSSHITAGMNRVSSRVEARTHSIDSGCYCYSWFLKPATGQLSRHTTFICKHIKKKSPNKRRLKKKIRPVELCNDNDTLSAYSEKLQWEYTHWIIHYAKALIYCGCCSISSSNFCFLTCI